MQKNNSNYFLLMFISLLIGFSFPCAASTLKETNLHITEALRKGKVAEVIISVDSANGGPEIYSLSVAYPPLTVLTANVSLSVTKGIYKIELLKNSKAALILTAKNGQIVHGSGRLRVDKSGTVKYRITAKKAEEIYFSISFVPISGKVLPPGDKPRATKKAPSNLNQQQPPAAAEPLLSTQTANATATAAILPVKIFPTNKHGNFIRFFESGAEAIPHNERKYENSFAASTTRFINWELNLFHPAPGSRIEYTVETIWRGSDGFIIAKKTKQAFIEPDSQNPYTSDSLGSEIAGEGWLQLGLYTVELYIEGVKITSGSFKVY